MSQNQIVAASRWIWPSILLGAGMFLLALAVSAYYVPQLRPLHALQSLIYVAVVALTNRNSSWGYGAGTTIAIVWNSLNLFVTHLFQAGAGELSILLHGGHVTRPETAMVTIGGIGHFILIAACLTGFLRRERSAINWGKFLAGGLLVLLYMALIIFTTAPQH